MMLWFVTQNNLTPAGLLWLIPTQKRKARGKDYIYCIYGLSLLLPIVVLRIVLSKRILKQQSSNHILGFVQRGRFRIRAHKGTFGENTPFCA